MKILYDGIKLAIRNLFLARLATLEIPLPNFIGCVSDTLNQFRIIARPHQSLEALRGFALMQKPGPFFMIAQLSIIEVMSLGRKHVASSNFMMSHLADHNYFLDLGNRMSSLPKADFDSLVIHTESSKLSNRDATSRHLPRESDRSNLFLDKK